MGKVIDLTGQEFGKLKALRPVGRSFGCVTWLCLCKGCGNQVVISSNKLRTGHTKSCGCLRKETISRVSKETVHLRIRHGHAARSGMTRMYRDWCVRIQRCTNPNNKAFKNYGGRGIKMCDRWMIFENYLTDFLAEIGEPPPGKTLDRWPDNDGNYEPGNVRWTTREEQNANSRRKGAKYTDRIGTLTASEAPDSARVVSFNL